MASASPRAVWAVLAPLPPSVLARHAENSPALQVVGGEGAYSAIVSTALGSEGLDRPIAQDISSRVSPAVYLLRLRDDMETVWVYRDGQRLEERHDDPWTLARSLGCRLPGAPATAHPVTSSVCVVLDRTPVQVARALGLDDVPASGPMHILPVPRGTIFYSEQGSVSILQEDISRATGARTYLLASRNGGAEFYSSLIDNGEELGAFEVPVFRAVRLPRLDEIEGKTNPREIALALGVAPELLGM